MHSESVQRRAFAAEWGKRVAILEEGKRGSHRWPMRLLPFGLLCFFYYYPYFSY